MEKITVKKVGELVNVNMTISKGKVLALMHALEVYPTVVASDLLFMLRQANKDKNGKSLVDSI